MRCPGGRGSWETFYSVRQRREQEARKVVLRHTPATGTTRDSLGMQTDAHPSVADLTARLTDTMDHLQAALAKLGGADAPSQQFGDPAAGRALALIAAGVESPDTVHMETPALHDHLMRLFGLFSSSSAAGAAASSGGGGLPQPAATARMTALGFRKLVRAAQLTCDRCTDVDVDLIYQQVVRTRGARMSPGDMMVGLGMVAKRLYSGERTQSAAFHRLLSEQLLPWMLQVRRRPKPLGPTLAPRPPLAVCCGAPTSPHITLTLTITPRFLLAPSACVLAHSLGGVRLPPLPPPPTFAAAACARGRTTSRLT